MMTMMLRVILIVVSVITMTFMMRKIRQAKVQIEAAMFWVIMALILVVFAVVPGAADLCARLLGIYSTPNFLFLFMIFLLIVKAFGMTIQLSQLESKQRELIQKMALEQKFLEEKEAELEEAMIKAAAEHEAEEANAEAEKAEQEAIDIEPKAEIEYDDFAKMQFQVGEIISCEAVKKSKKLLCSQVKIGTKTRQIVSGIKAHYSPEEMVGKKVMVVTNLKPAKLAGVVSEGMILCAEDAEGNLSLMVPEKKMPAGAEIC